MEQQPVTDIPYNLSSKLQIVKELFVLIVVRFFMMQTCTLIVVQSANQSHVDFSSQYRCGKTT